MKSRSSRSQFGGNKPIASTPNRDSIFSASPQPSLFEARPSPSPGSLNDTSEVRDCLVEAIRRSGKSRAAIADEMSKLTAAEITVRRINAMTAESREDYSFPAELVRAFCVVTNDFCLLRRLAELSGFRLIDEAEYDLLELGRQYLFQKRSEQQIAMLERKLGGRDL
jgi:hypothetical protein